MSSLFGGSTQTTTTQTDNSPWGPARGALRTGLRDAMQAYQQGIGSQVDTRSRVVPMAQQTSRGYNQLTNMANRNTGQQGLQGNLQGIINRGGFNNWQMNSLRGLRDTANSDYDFNANPGSQRVLQDIRGDVRDSVNLNAAAAGRYGSGTHEGVLAREIGDVSSQFRMNDYNNWLGRRDAAQSNMFNAAQAGIGNMTNAYQGMQQPVQSRLAVGSAYEDLQRRMIDDRSRIFDAQTNAPWNQIGRLMQVGNLGGQYQSSTGTTQAPGQNPFLTAAGGLSLLGGLL